MQDCLIREAHHCCSPHARPGFCIRRQVPGSPVAVCQSSYFLLPASSISRRWAAEEGRPNPRRLMEYCTEGPTVTSSEVFVLQMRELSLEEQVTFSKHIHSHL